MNAIDKYYSGDFNSLEQEWQSDGSVIVTVIKRGEGKIYRFRARNLCLSNEEVWDQEVIEKRTPDFLLARQDRANKARQRELK